MRALSLVLGSVAACGGGAAGPDAAFLDGWSKGPSLPEPLLEPGVATLGDELWVIGGFDAGLEVTTHVWVLGASDATWRAGPTAPAPFTHLQLAVVGGRLYLLGGLIGRDLTPDGRSWVLAADHGSWQPLATMPSGSERGAGAVIADPANDRIVVAGGADATDALGTVLVYSIANDTWSAGPDLPSPRSHPVGALDAAGEPVVIGGLRTLDATMPINDVVALVGDSWTIRAEMPTMRGGCSSTTIGSLFYCVGGEANDAVVRTAATYDLAADRWASLPDLPRGRGGTGGGTLGGKVYAPGGAHAYAYEPTDDVDVFDPAAAAP